MQITGTWHLYVRPPLGGEVDWDNLPKIVFRDGRITLADGSEPEYSNHKGVLRFSFPLPQNPPERRIANVLIDRGRDGYLQGWRYLAEGAVAAFPDPDRELPDGDRFARLQLIREDRFDAFRTEQEGYAAAIRRVFEEAAPDEEDEAAPGTVHQGRPVSPVSPRCGFVPHPPRNRAHGAGGSAGSR